MLNNEMDLVSSNNKWCNLFPARAFQRDRFQWQNKAFWKESWFLIFVLTSSKNAFTAGKVSKQRFRWNLISNSIATMLWKCFCQTSPWLCGQVNWGNRVVIVFIWLYFTSNNIPRIIFEGILQVKTIHQKGMLGLIKFFFQALLSSLSMNRFFKEGVSKMYFWVLSLILLQNRLYRIWNTIFWGNRRNSHTLDAF